jgi:uncharacterized protein (TIGR02246 family)
MTKRTAMVFLLMVAIPSLPAIAHPDPQKTALTKRDAKASEQIRAVLDAQVDAWNRGDIDGFMAGYANSPETVFISGGTITRGWQTVLNRYKKAYDSREKMGTLVFDEIEINMLDKDAAVVNGQWKLNRASDTPHGRFTLILRRLPEGWRVVHDHTSSAV